MFTSINEFKTYLETVKRPLSDYVGDNPSVDDFASNWNEEAFTYSDPDPVNVSEPILETAYKQAYFGGDINKAISVKEVYAVADDNNYKGRKLLVMKFVSEVPNLLQWDWSPVGEYDGENLGIMLAYRNKGAGKAFVKWLMKNNLLRPSIGYSPLGLKTVKSAYRELY